MEATQLCILPLFGKYLLWYSGTAILEVYRAKVAPTLAKRLNMNYINKVDFS